MERKTLICTIAKSTSKINVDMNENSEKRVGEGFNILVDLVGNRLNMLAVLAVMGNPTIHTNRIVRIHFDRVPILVDKAAKKKGKQ